MLTQSPRHVFTFALKIRLIMENTTTQKKDLSAVIYLALMIAVFCIAL